MTTSTNQAVEAAVQRVMNLVDDCARSLYGSAQQTKRARNALEAAIRAELARPLEVAAPVTPLNVFHQAWGDAKDAPGYNKAAFTYVMPFIEKAASQVPVASVPVASVAESVKMWHQRAQEAQPKSDPEFWPLSYKAGFMEDEIIELRAALAKTNPAPVPGGAGGDVGARNQGDSGHLAVAETKGVQS